MLVHVRNSACFRLRRRPPALRRPRPEQVGTFSLGFSCCLRTPENSRKSPQFHGKKDVFFSDACSFFVLGSCFLSFMVFVVFQHIGIQGRVPQRFIYFFVPTAGTQKSDL